MSDTTKDWKDEVKLDRHLQGTVHTKANAFDRNQKKIAETNGGVFNCPFCKVLSPADATEDSKNCKSWPELHRQMKTSSAEEV